MQQKRFWTFMGISLLLHLFLLLLVFSKLFHFIRIPDEEIKPNQITLTLQPVPPPAPPPEPPQKTQFADTTGLPQIEAPDPNAAFEGENNTLASSTKAPNSAKPLPSQDGIQKPGMEFTTSDYSPENKSKPVSSPSDQKPAKPDTPTEKPQPEKTAVADTGLKEKIQTADKADIQIAEKSEKETKPKQEQQTPAQQPTDTADSRGPPASFSAARRPTQMDGSAPMGPSSSVAVRESELGRYKAKLYRAIGSRWYQYVQNNGTVPLGTVKLRFYVQADGKITQLVVSEGSSLGALVAVSRRSVLEVSGQLEPFSDALRQQLGDGYWEEISFTIY